MGQEQDCEQCKQLRSQVEMLSVQLEELRAWQGSPSAFESDVAAAIQLAKAADRSRDDELRRLRVQVEAIEAKEARQQGPGGPKAELKKLQLAHRQLGDELRGVQQDLDRTRKDLFNERVSAKRAARDLEISNAQLRSSRDEVNKLVDDLALARHESSRVTGSGRLGGSGQGYGPLGLGAGAFANPPAAAYSWAAAAALGAASGLSASGVHIPTHDRVNEAKREYGGAPAAEGGASGVSGTGHRARSGMLGVATDVGTSALSLADRILQAHQQAQQHGWHSHHQQQVAPTPAGAALNAATSGGGGATAFPITGATTLMSLSAHQASRPVTANGASTMAAILSPWQAAPRKPILQSASAHIAAAMMVNINDAEYAHSATVNGGTAAATGALRRAANNPPPASGGGSRRDGSSGSTGTGTGTGTGARGNVGPSPRRSVRGVGGGHVVSSAAPQPRVGLR